jgi:HAMP domain-containing protein
MEMSARLEHEPLLIDEARIRRVLDRTASETEFRQLLPHVELSVERRGSLPADSLSGADNGRYRQQVNDGQKSYIFIQPIGRRPYSLTATFPAEDIYAKYERMQWVLLSWGIAAILTLLGLLYWAIVRHLAPLHRLADSAQAIAEGRLDTPIADTRRQDETGRLQNSLATMQQSLAGYISELRQKQDTMNQQHAALQAAYAEASAYEEKKSRFLHDMTERMAAPVARICRDTDTICRDFDRLSDDDMATLQTGVTRSSEDIITLLDQLIKDPAGT